MLPSPLKSQCRYVVGEAMNHQNLKTAIYQAELRVETNHVPRPSVAGPPRTPCHLTMVVLENPSVWVCCLSDVCSSFVLGVGAVKKVYSKEPLNLFGTFRCFLGDTLGLRDLRCHQKGV